MNVIRRSDTELELRQSPALVWLILGAFGIGGSWVLLQDGEPMLAAGFAVVILVLALAFAITTTCRFDRASGELTCARRSLLRATHTRHPLADIVGVRTERSAAQLSQSFRLVIVMSTGATVPLTTQFTSGRARHERTATVIRDFLGLADPVDVQIPGFGDLFRMAIGGHAGRGFDRLNAGAIAHHEEVVRRAPDDVEARRQLANALALSNRPAEARVHLEHARGVALRHGNDHIASQLGEAIRRLDLTAPAR